ncbi:DUF2510 domain-containing protein [Homoserinimonas sp. A447]
MSSAPEGWYVDPSTGTNLRLWNGTTWTDEVAPMPYEPTHSGEVDLLATTAPAEKSAEITETPAERATEDAPGDEAVSPDLDPEIEQTMLTRRELRARRGADTEVDDFPKHLPPIAPPTAVSVGEWQEPVEEFEIPAVPVAVQAEPEPADGPLQRRRRIIRMSVLLGVLAVVSSVAVLTAGTL